MRIARHAVVAHAKGSCMVFSSVCLSVLQHEVLNKCS